LMAEIRVIKLSIMPTLAHKIERTRIPDLE
jgi:hypothetical protein